MLTPLSETISRLGKRRLRQLRQYELWNSWEELVGASVAAHARPSSWRGTALVVTVVNNAWMQELLFMRHEIMHAIRRRFPTISIEDIRFELGTVDAPPPARSTDPAPPMPPLSDDEKDFARDTVRPVADEKTRETIRRLIERDLMSKKSQRS